MNSVFFFHCDIGICSECITVMYGIFLMQFSRARKINKNFSPFFYLKNNRKDDKANV